MSSLRRVGKIPAENCIILIDALCEAEYHKPDHGDTLSQFLARHASSFPSWLKIVATVRSHAQDIIRSFPYHKIRQVITSSKIFFSLPNDFYLQFKLFENFSLDKFNSNENLQKDLLDYINFRLNNSPSIQSNVASVSGKLDGVGGSSSQYRFSQHLLSLSKGSFLFAKLTLDLLERGHLVVKSSGYKVSCLSNFQNDVLALKWHLLSLS